MSYNLYFMSRKSGIQSEDPYAWAIPTLVKARKFAVGSLGPGKRTAVAIYLKDRAGMETYQGKVQYEGDGYFFHSYSGKKWRIYTDGRIVKLKKKVAPFGL